MRVKEYLLFLVLSTLASENDVLYRRLANICCADRLKISLTLCVCVSYIFCVFICIHELYNRCANSVTSNIKDNTIVISSL